MPKARLPRVSSTYRPTPLQHVFGFVSEFEFFLKVALSCVVLQQGFHWLLRDTQLGFVHRVILLWFVGSASFYAFGYFIEGVLKKNEHFRAKYTARVVKVTRQPFPAATAKGIFLGEIRALAVTAAILYLSPEVHRSNGLFFGFLWFFMRIFVADFLFYVAHWSLHQKPLRWIHIKHHEYRDTSAWVAGHKTTLEYLITTVTDMLPIFIFGHDFTQLCAWVVIGNAYNLEGHSSLSLFFISSDFHDLHHTGFHRNYGIQGFWDRIFATLNPPTRRRGAVFPLSTLEADFTRQNNTPHSDASMTPS